MLKDVSTHRPIWSGFDDLLLYGVEKEVQHCTTWVLPHLRLHCRVCRSCLSDVSGELDAVGPSQLPDRGSQQLDGSAVGGRRAAGRPGRGAAVHWLSGHRHLLNTRQQRLLSRSSHCRQALAGYTADWLPAVCRIWTVRFDLSSLAALVPDNNNNYYYYYTRLTALCPGLPRCRYKKGKTNLDFTEARDSEWQWRQLDHVQVCTLLQTDNHPSTPPLSFLQAGCPSCRPTNSVKALKAIRQWCETNGSKSRGRPDESVSPVNLPCVGCGAVVRPISFCRCCVNRLLAYLTLLLTFSLLWEKAQSVFLRKIVPFCIFCYG